MADYQLQVCIDENHLKFETKPTYLGVTLDQSLMFKVHLTKLKNKVSSRVALIRRLAGTKWGGFIWSAKDICPGTGLFSCRVLYPSQDAEYPCPQD